MGFFSKLSGFERKSALMKEATDECKAYERNRDKLQHLAESLYHMRKQSLQCIIDFRKVLDEIENLPSWFDADYNNILESAENFKIAVAYEDNPEKLAIDYKNSSNGAKIMGVGIAAGGATAIWGGSVAMSIATVLGTASTGTAISALSGIAATNAALAWLGGGAVVSGGAGIAGGTLVLSLIGPIGWSIAGASALGGFAWMRKKNRKEADDLLKKLDEIKRCNLALIKGNAALEMLIQRTRKFVNTRFAVSMQWAQTVEPKDYKQWDDEYKHKLEATFNVMTHMVQLINERIYND